MFSIILKDDPENLEDCVSYYRSSGKVRPVFRAQHGTVMRDKTVLRSCGVRETEQKTYVLFLLGYTGYL